MIAKKGLYLFLYQEQSGFLFNSDSHFLYDFISQFNPKGKVLDVGCGCGILGLLTARDFPISLHSIDTQVQNITITEHNTRVNQLTINTYHDDFLKHDFQEKFDFILSNPPYYHDGVSKSDNSSLHISRYNEHLPLEAFIQKANSIIAPRGHLIFCYDAKQIQAIMISLSQSKFNLEDIRFVHGTEDKPSTLVMIHARKGSNALCKIHPALIHFTHGENSQEIKNIYQKTRTYSIKCTL